MVCTQERAIVYWPRQHKKAAVTFYILTAEMLLKDSEMNKASSVFVYVCGLASSFWPLMDSTSLCSCPPRVFSDGAHTPKKKTYL